MGEEDIKRDILKADPSVARQESGKVKGKEAAVL
jgi:hypothetical protein